MRLSETAIPDIKVIDPDVHGDSRGFFIETWNARRFADAGLDVTFVQDNHSRSAAGVLRGMHYQLNEPQGKLVRVARGRVFDVAVDLRRRSPSFGQWVGLELSAANGRMLWIPPGFAHGFLTLEDDTDFLYKCTAFYAPTDEHCLAWDDPTVAIGWPSCGAELVISDKDRRGKALADAEVYA